jgi:glycosyltransferase involved in cell wall biosynthesis
LIVTAHNEAESIKLNLDEILQSFHNVENLEIIVSEDGSTDQTRIIILELISKHNIIKLTDESPRLGYTEAIKRAIKIATGEVLIFTDGDGQINPDDLRKLLELFDGNGILRGIRSKRMDGNFRNLGSFLFRIVFQFLGFPKVIDPSAGTIVGKKHVIESIIAPRYFLSYGFWWEFQIWRNELGIENRELEISHRARKGGKTKVYKLRNIIQVALTQITGLIKVKINLSNQKNQI